MIEQWFPNGWLQYLLGGILIGSGVGFAFLCAGLVTGLSTFFSSSWSWVSQLEFFQRDRLRRSRGWRAALALGLLIGGLFYTVTFGGGTPGTTTVPGWQLGVGGVLIGFGARLSDGCTSGHGICGLASLQLPSLLAVLTFLATAMATAQLVRALGGV